MEQRGWIVRHGFWPLALLWLPAGVAAQAAVRFGPATDGPPDPAMWAATVPMAVSSLVVAAPCGLPLAFGCRRLWRLGYRRGAWWAGVSLGALTVAASVLAGLPGPVAIAVCAVVLGLPAWRAWWWLGGRGRCRTAAGRLRSKRDRRSAGGNGNDQQTGTHEFSA